MSATDKVKAIVEPSLEAMGYEVVRVQLTGGDRPTLQIMAERADRGEMTVDHCAKISRTVETPTVSLPRMASFSDSLSFCLIMMATSSAFSSLARKV